MPAESKSLSEFPRALEVLSGALLLISNPSGQDSFDTNSALLTEVAQAMLDVHYTQELGDVSVFDAIKNCRVLSGTTTPTSVLGADGQLYIKYETTGGADEVVAMYFKKSSTWLEISLGGGNTDYIECTQAQYDTWEQGGTLDPDTLYFITDGNIGNDIIDDSTASETKVYSSDKVEDLLSDKQDATDNSLATTSKTIVGAINEVQSEEVSLWTRKMYIQEITISNLNIEVPYQTYRDLFYQRDLTSDLPSGAVLRGIIVEDTSPKMCIARQWTHPNNKCSVAVANVGNTATVTQVILRAIYNFG